MLRSRKILVLTMYVSTRTATIEAVNKRNISKVFVRIYFQSSVAILIIVLMFVSRALEHREIIINILTASNSARCCKHYRLGRSLEPQNLKFCVQVSRGT